MVVFPALSSPTIMTLCSGGTTKKLLNILVNTFHHTEHCRHSSFILNVVKLARIFNTQTYAWQVFERVTEKCAILYTNNSKELSRSKEQNNEWPNPQSKICMCQTCFRLETNGASTALTSTFYYLHYHKQWCIW